MISDCDCEKGRIHLRDLRSCRPAWHARGPSLSSFEHGPQQVHGARTPCPVPPQLRREGPAHFFRHRCRLWRPHGALHRRGHHGSPGHTRLEERRQPARPLRRRRRHGDRHLCHRDAPRPTDRLFRRSAIDLGYSSFTGGNGPLFVSSAEPRVDRLIDEPSNNCYHLEKAVN